MNRKDADARLRDVIVDPVGTSLQATNSLDDSKPFQDTPKEDIYSLYDARTLDVWERGKDASTRLEEHPLSRKLPARLFDPDSPRAPRTETLVFRLLVTRPAMDANQEAWHDDLSEAGQKQINHLPFDPEAVQELVNRYHLPEHWTYLRMAAREVGNFHRETSWDFTKKEPIGTRLGIIIHFPFVLRPARQLHFLKLEGEDKKGQRMDYRRKYPGKWKTEYYPHRDDPFIWSFAMSHNLQDGKTRGILDGLTDAGLRNIRDQLSPPGKTGWYEHPLDLPTILLKIYSRHTQWEINRLADDVANFEEAAKREKYKEIDQFDDITTQLAYLDRSLDFEQNLTQSLLDTLQYLEEKIFPKALEAGSTGHTTFIQRTNPQVQEKLTNIASMIQNNRHTCTYFQARTKDALEYINALMNRDDAEFNQKSAEYQNMGMKSQLKDAQANKTISIVTMTFLPATAVAAICSMEIFDWRQEEKVWVSPHFWIFWVNAIVLTALVLGIFLIWKRRLHAQEREQDQEEEEQKAKREAGGEDDDSDMIPDEPKYRASSRQRGDETTPKQRNEPERLKSEEKQSYVHQQEDDGKEYRSSRRKSRHRSRKRSHTQSRDGRDRSSFGRTASGLNFRGQSEIV